MWKKNDYRLTGRNWRRRSRFGEWIFCVNPQDTSAMQDSSGGYDARCPSCWLHFAHTKDYHDQNLRSHAQARTS